LLDAVKSGDISEDRLNRSVEKILRAKAWLGLPMSKRVDLNAISGLVDDPKLQDQAQQMADASMVLVSDSRQLLPFDARRIQSVHVILVLGRDQQEDTATFQQELRRRVEAKTLDMISVTSTDSELAKVLERAKGAERLICAIFARLVTGTGTVYLPEKLADWVSQLVASEPPPVIVAFGNPYLLQQIPRTPSSLCTFSNADVSQVSAVKAIFGEIPVKGKLPVSIPGVANIYSGVERTKLDMKLKDGMSGEFQPVQEHLITLDNLIEQSIRRRAFPGASISIGYKGSLIYQKAFGKFDYSQNGKPVTTTTLYDLASLTKVVAATTLAMQLCESGDLKLEFPVSRFYPSFTGGARERITIKHLLTHTSGLPAHLAFYKDTQGKSEFVKRILTTPLEYEPGAKMIYSDLGVILLGDILEKITAKPLDVLAHSRIFAPLGMDHTLFKPGGQLKAQIAPTEKDPWRDRLIQGEVHDENAYAMGGVSAHAGLFSTSGDLAIFCQMLLNGGVYNHHRLVKRSTLEQFVARQEFPPGSSRALGWDTPSEGSSAGSLLPSTSFGHTGFTGTSIWVDPTRQLFIILLTNRVCPTRENNAILEVRRQVADAVVRAVEEPHH
jgi:CubicO group peptidase (beta-lactamase class C family)